MLFLRYGISAVALLLFVRSVNRRELKVGGLLGLSQAAVLVLETYGVTHTSAANAGLIISLTLVLTPLMDRRRMPPKFFLAAGVCIVAVGLLMSGNGLHTPGIGDLLMLAAAVVRAAHVALVGRLATDLRPLQVTTVQTVVGTALFAGPAVGHLPTDAGAGDLAATGLPRTVLQCLRVPRPDLGRAAHLRQPGQSPPRHRTGLGCCHRHPPRRRASHRSGRDRRRTDAGRYHVGSVHRADAPHPGWTCHAG